MTKKQIVDLLTQAFDKNPSVNYVVKNDAKRVKRIEHLMNYAFEKAMIGEGKIFSNQSETACAIVFFKPNNRKSLKSLFLDIKLIYKSIGVFGLPKLLNREKQKSKKYVDTKFAYLMFLGVSREAQGKGYGTNLMKNVISYCSHHGLAIWLETSEPKNIPFYKRLGFELYSQIDNAPRLYFFRYEP